MSLDHARLAAALKPPALVARMRETADAEAGFSKGGRELCERLASTARAVRDVLHACAPIAEVLDRGVPDTLQQAHDVVADGQLCSVAAPLCPLWFEPAQRPLAAALAETGGKLAAAAAEGRRRLEVSAATALIQADSAGLLDRLLGTSRPIVGVFYRRRRRRLLAEVGQVLGRDTPPALEEASALLAAARAVAVASDWLVASESEAQRLLGAWFVGPRTDWPGVAEALGTCPAVAALLDRCRSDDCRQSLSALLYERPAARSALAEAAQRADACLAAAEGALQALDAELALSAANDLYVEPLAQLAQTLDAEAEAARAYLDAYDKAGACYGFSLDPGATSPGLVRGHLQEALDLADERRNGRLATNSGPLRQEFGDLFADYDTDWDAVAGALDWAAELRCAFADAVPHAVAVVASGPVEGLIRVRQCRQAVGQLRADLAPAFGALGTWFPQGVDGRPMADVAMTALHDRVRACLADVPGRRAWLSLQHWQERAARLGLAPFIAELADAGIPFGNAQPAFWRRFWQLWLEAVAQQRPWLWPNEALDLPASVSRFQSADRQLIASGCVRVRRRLSERRQSTGVGSVQGGGIGLISREVGKKRRQKPLRVLLREAGFAVQQLRPCFLMSPLSVATYLGDPSMRFDVVIFDEASQVRTQDAVGAILRGRQLIVAGDERQLPPTSFFQTSLDDDEHEPEEQQVDNYDSVLDELGSSGLDRHRLHWHYRSRREGLIVFSNRHIYDDDPLQTFPEPEQGAKADPAVTWVHVPAGRYRGRLGNAEEASVVARLVVDHYRARPDRSMGVIAFGQSHQQAIEEALRAALRADPELHGYFTGDRLEPFFVKNLETVQGDERDAIILTVGYGRGPDGQLRRFYGPLNNEGGERRLNVAITRAKHQLTVVSSVLADELAVDDSKHRGPKLLRDYLRYAETGWLDRVDAGTDAFDSPLEVSVCEALRERGLLVETQIGCSGYRIDMAIRDPDTGRYLLGIECDGAMYHRAKTARDRDRLRQEVLEQRGWRLLRIWSTDWLRSNGSQIDRVFAALEEGPQPPPLPLAGPLPPPTAPPPLPPTTEPEPPVDSGPDASVPGTVPYRKWDPPHQLLHPELFYDDLNLVAKLVSTVVATEGPVSLSLTTERLCEAFGFDRAGERIREQVRAAARLSAGDERLRKDGLFLWPKDLATAPVRRPAAGEQPRAIADIPPDEVREAAALIVRGAGGIDAEALVTQTSRLLGYQRTGQNIAHAVQAAIAGLDRDPRFERRGGLYYPIGAVDAVRVAADATHQPLHDTPPLPERPGWQWLRNAWLFSSPDRSRTAYIFPVAGRQFWVH
ncbi:MAG: DUF3320 domain-containing protein, partial [Armatimonadetes bacterium]|nr:DUF3320 domain-containing protein [Armatimonadota bacterium]